MAAESLNKHVRSYRVFSVANGGKPMLVAEVDGRTFSYAFTGADPAKAYVFAVAAVDRQNLEGQKAFAQVS